MNTAIKTLTALALGATLVGPAQANPANVERVTEGLIAAGMALELADQCDSVSVRMIRGLNFLQGLKRHLKDLGYSNAEIDAFIENDAEKSRLEGIARARLADLGAQSGDPSSYCRVALNQMSVGSQVGRLLR